MKAVVLTSHIQDYTALSVSDSHAKPAVLPGHVLVKVHAASINPVDKLLTFGIMTTWNQPFPYVSGEDFSGVVAEVGADVSNVKVGDEVFASNWGQGRHDDLIDHPVVGGAFAEYLLIPAHKLSHKPAALSHEAAAGIGIAGTTAYECLFQHGKIEKDSKILILGASSAVGIFAVQMAKLKGAYVAVTCSSRTKEFVESELKPDYIVNYNEAQWENDEHLRNFDVVFDTIGESNGLKRAVDNHVVKADGKYVSIADFSIGFDPNGHPPLSFGAAICFLQNPQTQSTIAEWIVEGKVKFFVDERFPLTTEGVQAMFHKIGSGKSVGKNILQVVV